MNEIRTDVSHNPSDNNKEYDRTVYKCIEDDTWVTVEIPMGKSPQNNK